MGVNSADLGKTASGASGDTVFRIQSSTGSVTRVSGVGARVVNNSARATVTISCGNQNACNNRKVNVTISSAGATNRARPLSNFNVAMGTAVLNGSVSGSDPLSFQINPIGKNSSKTFYVGADFPIAGDNSGLTTQSAAATFFVDLSTSTGSGSGSGSGAMIATVYRSLSLAQNSALSFGRVVRPLSGSGSATLAASNGARTSSNLAWLTLPSPNRAYYTASGEGGQVLSVFVPSSFTMTRAGGGSVTVDTNNSAAPAPLLSAYPGSSGTYSFFVGGTLNVSNATPGGAYSGAFAVTVAYN